jgi:hypothetical protein
MTIEKDGEYVVSGSKQFPTGDALFVPEFKVKDILTEAYGNGNWACKNALSIDEYTFRDEPFWYGKVGSLGYVLSEKHLHPQKVITQDESK